jgi:hypothetical protein
MAPASRVIWLRQKPDACVCVLIIEQMLADYRDPGGDQIKQGDTKSRASLMVFGP